MKRISIRVSGKVQGVFYRQSTREKAEELALNGYVRNEDDGTVYIEAEGDETNLEKLVEWCHTGPSRARVDVVSVNDLNVKNEKGFEVRR